MKHVSFGREIVDIGAQSLSNFKAFIAASIGSFYFILKGAQYGCSTKGSQSIHGVVVTYLSLA
jgi:hypothetical protein